MSTAPVTQGFLAYQAEHEDEIFAFQRNEYPDRAPNLIAPNWRWMFLDSAARLGLEPSVWLYRKNNVIVAHQGAIPILLHIGDEESSTGWFVETMAAASVRGTAIGPMLIKKALEDMPLNLSLGQTGQMRDIQFALGWKKVCSLNKYMFVSGYRMNLRNKLPMLFAEFAAASLGLWHNLRWRQQRSKIRPQFRFQEIDRFTREHDELWERMARTCTCAVVRNSSYMNWKYIDRPFRSFSCIEIRDGDDLAGVVVVMVADQNDVYRHIRGYLVDFLVPLNRLDYILALIIEGIGVLKSRGAQTIICQIIGPEICTALERIGFIAREPRHQFLVAPGVRRERVTQRLLEPQNWFLTLGDSDADSYAD